MIQPLPASSAPPALMRERAIQRSDDIRVALSPERTYAALVRSTKSGSWLRAGSRPLFVAFTIGAATTIAATGVVSLPSIISGAICWSFIPAVQLFNGLFLCVRPPQQRADTARTIELLFLSHAPWSLWLILVALVFVWAPLTFDFVRMLLATAVLPLVWTFVLVAAFCRSVLGCTPGDARRRSLVHLALSLILGILYVSLAVSLWPRIIGGLS